MAETSTKPYMIRALYEWCCDNGYTPYLAVAVDEHTLVPRQHVKGGEIVLNVSPMATSRLSLGNELVEFQARFSGVAQQLSIPVGNVSAIYARETGQGMAFEVQARAAQVEGDEGEAVEGTGGGIRDASGEDDSASPTAGDETGRHGRGSTVQSLRSGTRRRGPRRVELEVSGDHSSDQSSASSIEDGAAGVDGIGSETNLNGEKSLLGAGSEGGRSGGGQAGSGVDGGSEAIGKSASESRPAEASNSRRRTAKGQGSADVLAFAPAADSTKKKKGSVAAANVKPDQGEEDAATLVDTADEDEDPPPAEGGGKGGKARLTRVK